MVGDGYLTPYHNPVESTIVNVLLIEDNLAEARLLQEFLKGTLFNRFSLVHVKRLQEAIHYLVQAHSCQTADRFDVILLDLTLPDSQGLASLASLIQQAPSLPIVVLTNTNDDELAVSAVRHGAQDYLVKRQVNPDILIRSLRYAIERKQASEALREANEVLEIRVQERTAELATANERLKQQAALLDIATDAIFVTTLDDRILFWNKGAERLYGWSMTDALGQNAIELLHTAQESIPTSPEIQQTLVQTGEWQSELWQVTQASKPVLVQSRWTVVYDAIGQPHSILIVNTDITEKKQLEAQFLRAQRLESLGTLAGGIAHDLNNILTPILAIAKLLPLKLPDLDERNRQMLQTLEASAHCGADLVKQILLFVRGGEGKRQILQISDLLPELETMIRQTFPKSIEIQTQIAPDLRLISADATQLHQVLMNLCVNARDAMPQGGTLTLAVNNLYIEESQARLHLDAHVGHYITIAVTDTGTGIPPEIIHHIFDPFFTTKDIGKGTGLGLSAVLGIVKSQGGFVDVQSQIGHGSQFIVYLSTI